MADNLKYAQLQPFNLAGSGISIGATTITLTSFLSIDGVPLTMANFGTIGFGTLEPNSFQNEEQISFTGITQNLNGSATLTGVKHVEFLDPYTETAGVTKSHAGGVAFVISNTSGFYNTFTNKNDDETILGAWVLPGTEPARPKLSVDVDATDATSLITYGQLARAVFGAVPSASTTVNGTVELATAAELAAGTAVGGTGAFLVPANSSFNTTPAVNKVPVSRSSSVINQGWIDLEFTSGEAIDSTAVPKAVYMKISDGKVYNSIATGAGETLYSFVGFVTLGQNVAVNTTVTVRTWGIVPGFAGLTIGEDYLLTDVAGTISLTGGTFLYIVGVAKSATELLIRPGKKLFTAILSFSGTSVSVSTTGFRPQNITFEAYYAGGTARASGSWSSRIALIPERYVGVDAAGGLVNGSSSCYSIIDGATSHVGNITAITNTSFTLTNTKTGAANNIVVYVIAEG